MCKAKVLSSELVNSVIAIRKTSDELNKQLSHADKIICDLQHEIEFGKFDVCKGFKKFKQLQCALIERRNIKNEWELIQPLIAYVGNIEKNVDKIHNIIIDKEIKFENRTYFPRVLNNVV